MKPVVWIFLIFLLSGCAKAEFNLADGSALGLSELRGKWLVINYWAEWCAPCRMEIPELNQLQKERGEQDLVVLGVNFDGISGADLLHLKEKMGIEFPVLTTDPAARWDAERPTVLPTTLLIDPEGKLKWTLVGPQTGPSLEKAMGLTSAM